MNEDYLWDKSGQPDEEIERLERILETLRYKPRPFLYPSSVQTEKRRSVFPRLAIAAMILMTLFAAGLWISLKSPMIGEISQLPLPVEAPPTLHTRETAMATQPDQDLKPKRAKTPSLALIVVRAKERQEAAAAKQQVMLALRLASSKLRGAQKKARVTPAIIRNQHKVG